VGPNPDICGFLVTRAFGLRLWQRLRGSVQNPSFCAGRTSARSIVGRLDKHPRFLAQPGLGWDGPCEHIGSAMRECGRRWKWNGHVFRIRITWLLANASGLRRAAGVGSDSHPPDELGALTGKKKYRWPDICRVRNVACGTGVERWPRWIFPCLRIFRDCRTFGYHSIVLRRLMANNLVAGSKGICDPVRDGGSTYASA